MLSPEDDADTEPNLARCRIFQNNHWNFRYKINQQRHRAKYESRKKEKVNKNQSKNNAPIKKKTMQDTIIKKTKAVQSPRLHLILYS